MLATEFPGVGRFLFSQPGINPLLLVRAYREGGYYADAKRMLQDSLADAKERNAPRQSVVPLYRELSVVEAELGNSAGVVEACREAVKLAPTDPALSIALAVALANHGDHDAASQHLQQLAESFSDQVQVQKMLGQAWLSMRDAPNASKCFARVVNRSPDDVEARVQLATCLQMQGKVKQASGHFEEVLTKRPSHTMAANNLAWIYATSQDASARNGKRAVQLAETACRLTENKAAALLGTLSASYAEVGAFDRATKTAGQAMKLARESGQLRLAADIEKRLKLHQQGLPYRDPASK